MRAKIAFAVFFGVTAGSAIFFLPWLVFMLLAIAAVAFSLSAFVPYESRRFLLALFAWGLLLRIIAALMLFIVSYGSNILRPPSKNVNPGETIIAGDASGYSAYGWLLSEYWKGDRSIFTSDDKVALGEYFFTAQTYLSAALYYLFGYIPLLPIILNCLMGASSAIIIFFITHALFGLASARLAAMLTMFWPSIFLWSVNNTKEPMSILSMLTAILAGIMLYRKLSLRFLALFAAGFSAFLAYQPQLAIFLLLWIGLIFSIKTLRYPAVKACLPIIITVCIVSMLLINSVMPIFEIVRVKFAHVINATISRNIGSFLTGGSVYKIFPDNLYNNDVFRTGNFITRMAPAEWLTALVKGFFYFIFAPFPWVGGSLLQSIAKIEILLWYVLAPFFFCGVFLNFRLKKKESALLIVLLAVITLVYSLAEANVGTTFRHRSILLPLYFIFTAFAVDYFGIPLNRVIARQEKHNYGKIQ